MQTSRRKWYIWIELETFREFSPEIRDKDILEAGCGSGYAESS